MTQFTRRSFTLAALAGAGMTAACASNGTGTANADTIDARVNATMDYLLTNYPNVQEVMDKSVGQLVMPLVTEAGLFIGGGYGRGALRIDGMTADYYSTAKGSFGLQFGAQQYAHVLFFMTQDALENFRRGSGWAIGADMEYVFSDVGENVRTDTTTTTSPVLAVVFGQAGMLAGASLEGMKYTRIIP